MPEGFNPERHIHSMLTEINDNELDNDYQEIIDTARTIVFEQDAHNYLSKIIDFLGIERSVGLARIVDLGKVRTSIPRTKNENFSHLISMGYQ